MAPITPMQRTQLERWLCRARDHLSVGDADAAWTYGRDHS